jgi:hypothetical protein
MSILDGYLTEVTPHALTGDRHTGFDFLDGYLTADAIAHFLTYADIDGYLTADAIAHFLTYADIDGYTTLAVFDDHSVRHEVGGDDEISVAGLSGVLADAQTPIQHGFTDPVFHSGMSVLDGYLTEVTPHALTGDRHTGLDFLDGYLTSGDITHFLTYADIDGYATLAVFNDHSTRHEADGDDEISVAGLDGYLADPQNAYEIQGRFVTGVAPADEDALVWNAAASRWEPKAQSGGGVSLARIMAAVSLRI